MDPTEPYPTGISWQEDTFEFIKPDEFENLGINPTDIPLGTFPAVKHPTHIQSRFGGNAYGFGLFEAYERLEPDNVKLLQSITLDNPENIRHHYQKLNKIYKTIGLLIRFSSLGKPYYMIPSHLVSSTLAHVKSKVDEITKIVGFHRKKYFTEHQSIGLITHPDDLIAHELAFRFKEHRFEILDSLETLKDMNQTLDLIIFTRDLYEIILMERFTPLSQEMISRKRLGQYALYILWQVFNCLKPDGELFFITNHYPSKTNKTTHLIFKTPQEEKNFALFSHIFKTRKKYRIKNHSLRVNVFDFQKYLSGLYVEQEVINELLAGNPLEDLPLEDIEKLPYKNFQLTDWPFLSDQEKTWPGLLSVYFEKIFLKPLVPSSVKAGWGKRFSCTDYDPKYLLIYLGKKKPLKTTVSKVIKDIRASRITGTSTDYLAHYKDSFEYVIRTLRVIGELKEGTYKGLPQFYVDLLRQPLENRNRRFSAVNHVLKLLAKIHRLEKIREDLNPGRIESSRTEVLKNLESLTFFGFSHNELKEIVHMVLGHTPLGRTLAGKMSEKALKPVTDLARTYDPQDALNLLRYCLLMTMAETKAARGSEGTQEELSELFNLYESTIRVVTNRALDWEILMDEKINALGGIHNKIVRKILKMMNYFEFLDNWYELRQKAQMEKESLADYDEQKLARIENVIQLVNTIEQFEEMYLKIDPLQLPAFYRKFLDIEFHGTGHLFKRMESRNVFILLWVTVNLVRGKIINFNPILADIETSDIADRVKKVEQEARAINIDYLALPILRSFSEKLYRHKTSFILGTGFQIRIDPETKDLEISCMDMPKVIEKLETLTKKLAGRFISKISIQDLKTMDSLFSNLEGFYRHHQRLLDQPDSGAKLPARQRRWFQIAQNLRKYIRSNFLAVIFHPEDIHTNIDLLYRHAPSILDFILPEFALLEDLDLSWHLYLKSPIPHYIIASLRKYQALIRHDRESFQDTRLLHTLAQREFGPMAAGIIGVSESQIEALEGIVERLSQNRTLFDALTRSFIFQDIGRIPHLREKYKSDIQPTSFAYAGAVFLKKEKTAKKYRLDETGEAYLIFMVRHHSLLHHIVRGELSFSALQGIIDSKNNDLCDAFFVFSFIMLSAIREDLMREDLADWLFRTRTLCQQAIDGETTLESELHKVYEQKGKLFYALENYKVHGLPDGMTQTDYLESKEWKQIETSKAIRSGKMIFAMGRLFRLQGIRYVEFLDLVNLMLKLPMKYIYKKRRFSSVGYSTFEKEVFEAFRIYNTLQNLTEETRHFILDQLVEDRIRIFGYEKVSGYLSYENQIKLLLLSLLGTRKFKPNGLPVRINFLGMTKIIEKRYEAINDFLNTISLEGLFDKAYDITLLFKVKTGIFLRKKHHPNVLSVDFQDRVNILQKISYMTAIDNADQLKNYYHYGLRSLRKSPFYTEDYERQLEKAFEKRLAEISDMILDQAKKQMDLVRDFKELNNIVNDLLEQSLDIGLSDEQKHRLNDLYELRKDSLKRHKLSEIDGILGTINDSQALQDYWDSVKWYLQANRRFFGKEFEILIARKFDELSGRIGDHVSGAL
jgi:hypothetical protein